MINAVHCSLRQVGRRMAVERFCDYHKIGHSSLPNGSVNTCVGLERFSTNAYGAEVTNDVWTLERVRALGLTTDVVTAAAILGFGRTLAFDLLREGQFPVPVMRAGRTIRVSVPALLKHLGVSADES